MWPCPGLDNDKMRWPLFSVLGFPLPYGLKCSLEFSRSHWGDSSLTVGPSSSPTPSLPFQRITGSLPFFFFFFKCYAKETSLTESCYYGNILLSELGGNKNCNDSIWRFSDLQWVPAKMSCHRDYSLLLKPENDVGSMCVCVYEWVCGTCVYIYV